MDAPLPRRFSLYVPCDRARGDSLVAMVEAFLCERLGGVTSYPARGTFKLNGGERVTEDILVLECYCEKAEWNQQQSHLLTLAAVIGGLLRQESIAVAIDGRMRMITPVEPDASTATNESGNGEIWLAALIEKARVSGRYPEEA